MARYQSRWIHAAAVVLLLVARRTQAADPFPRIDAAERALVAATRAAAEAQCDCGAARSHRAYLRCVSHAMKALAAGRLSKRAMHQAVRCAQRSTCGRAGTVTCCTTGPDGRTQCGIVRSGKCQAPRAGSACVSSFSSWCDAIERGCPRQAGQDINCCLPSSSASGAFVCESQTPTDCTAQGGVDVGGDGSCVPDPCGAVSTTTTTVGSSTTTTTEALIQCCLASGAARPEEEREGGEEPAPSPSAEHEPSPSKPSPSPSPSEPSPSPSRPGMQCRLLSGTDCATRGGLGLGAGTCQRNPCAGATTTTSVVRSSTTSSTTSSPPSSTVAGSTTSSTVATSATTSSTPAGSTATTSTPGM